MKSRILLAACVAMLPSGAAFGQLTAYRTHVATFNPYYYAPAYHAPASYAGSTHSYVGSHANVRPAAWTIPGRYNAFPWNGTAYYSGGTGAFGSLGYYNGFGYLGGYFAPRYSYWAGIPLGLDSTYIGYSGYSSGYWPYAGAGYNNWYPGNASYSLDNQVMAYAPAPAAPSPEPAAPDNHAIIAVRVPFDAKVTVQGAATKQIGENRTFISPPLEPGQDYDYTIKVQWNEGGKAVEQTQTVTVRPGERSAVVFISAAGA